MGVLCRAQKVELKDKVKEGAKGKRQRQHNAGEGGAGRRTGDPHGRLGYKNPNSLAYRNITDSRITFSVESVKKGKLPQGSCSKGEELPGNTINICKIENKTSRASKITIGRKDESTSEWGVDSSDSKGGTRTLLRRIDITLLGLWVTEREGLKSGGAISGGKFCGVAGNKKGLEVVKGQAIPPSRWRRLR